MKGKYVVGLTQGPVGPTVAAVLFPHTVVHADIAVRFFGGKHMVIGAGFYHLLSKDEGIEVKSYGRSDSLDVASRAEDHQYLEQALGLIEYLSGAQSRRDLETLLARRRGGFESAPPPANMPDVSEQLRA